MPRPFQTWTRAQIAERYAQIEKDQAALKAMMREVETAPIDVSDLKADPRNSPEILELAQSMRRSNRLIELNELHIAGSREVQELNTELYIRDDPKLSAELGPGAD